MVCSQKTTKRTFHFARLPHTGLPVERFLSILRLGWQSVSVAPVGAGANEMLLLRERRRENEGGTLASQPTI